MKKWIPICAYSFITSLSTDNVDFPKQSVKGASEKSSKLIRIYKEKTGIPGICVNVNVGGRYSLDFNFGYSDIENLEKCKTDSLMRIASISKTFTSLLAAKLIDEGLLDLDKDINDYLPDFPKKTFKSEKVVITCRELLSHRSGIRDYKVVDNIPEYNLPEFLNQSHCSDSLSTRKCFQDDDLVFSPGQKYLYSVYGFVLLGSVLEKAAAESCFFRLTNGKIPKDVQLLEEMFNRLFQNLGLTNTHCEYNKNILMNRSRLSRFSFYCTFSHPFYNTEY